MNNADSYLYCSNINEWVSKLKMIKSLTEEERRGIAMKNLAYASENFSNEIIDITWKNIFKKLS